MVTLKTHLAVIGVILCCGAATAKTPTPPSIKPPVIYASEVVSTQDATIVREAIRAADGRDWAQLRQLRRLAQDEAVSDFVLWNLALAGTPNVGFDTLNEAMIRLEDWPRARAIRISAEEAIVLSSLSHEQRVLWFDALGGPISGEGKAAYGESLRQTGSAEAAYPFIRDAWRNHTINRATERDILTRYPELLTQDDHRARMDYLLWTSQRGAANRLRRYLTADYRALTDARIALKWRGRGVDAKVSAVPAHLQENAGLLFDRARWRRRRARNQPGATDLLVKIDGLDVPLAGRDNLWDERNIAVRASLKRGAFRTAYTLAAPHGLSSGADFADAEWIAGWIALRMLNEPEKAAAHFATLKAGVSTPISLSRADYWHGRALKELGATDEATAAFRSASVHNYAYYGQLAAEQIGETYIALPQTPAPTEGERDGFRDRPQIRLLRLLGEVGDRSMFRRFAFHIDDQLQTPTEQILLAEIGEYYHQPDIGVRGGKAGLGRGIIAPEAAYPVISYPLRRTVQVENALVLALSRQESELNPRAISHANARGLMQLIPATARTQARREGLPFRTSWLTDDPGYNMTLGAAHLDDLLDQFNGSYIMTAAAYNAGPRRPKQWIIDYGDPRRGEIDPIDWVELIPFSETRNYVQRVLENVQVYRHRISGEPGQIRILSDLQRGRLL
ncbi:MAG: lytic transglycosylase domain-containing protein [Pseudomonadota bacterium]